MVFQHLVAMYCLHVCVPWMRGSFKRASPCPPLTSGSFGYLQHFYEPFALLARALLAELPPPLEPQWFPHWAHWAPAQPLRRRRVMWNRQGSKVRSCAPLEYQFALPVGIAKLTLGLVNLGGLRALMELYQQH